MSRRSNQLFAAAGLAFSLGIAACAPPPRPAVMAEASQVGSTPAAAESAELAPQAYAQAEKMRALAEEAYANEDFVGAQLYSERAIAAYHRAHALARIARANRLSEEAGAALRESDEKLALTERQLEEAMAEVENLELRIQVAKDALAPTPSAPTKDPRRERARLASAQALALDARLLCAAAKLLSEKAPGLNEAEATLGELEARLAEPKPNPAPIDEASRARAACLASLTAARRAADMQSSTGRADALLATLSELGGFEPSRDDRGIVVTLRKVFQKGALSKEAQERLNELGRVAKDHPAFPLQIVVHASGPTPSRETLIAQGGEIGRALSAMGLPAERLHVEAAGATKPVVDPSGRDRHRNERVEIVFVNPGG